jgi:hypothetical protein
VWKVVGTGDFNGDGTSDVLWQDQSTGLVGAWLIKNAVLNGWAGFSSPDPTVWIVVGVGDFNGDSTSDVLLENQATGLVGAWIIKSGVLNGWAGFSSTDPTVWKVVGAGDYNGGKTSDVLWQNQSTGLVGAWLVKNAALSGWAELGSPDPTVWKIAGGGQPGSSALHAANAVAVPASDVASLTQSDLQSMIQEAIARWDSAGLDASAIARLTRVEFAIDDLNGSLLGQAEANRVTIDSNAAGHGWFVDSTPTLDEEYTLSPSGRRFRAIDPQAVDRIDLLTVVEHELGHILGFDDLDALADNLMSRVLGAGVRHNPAYGYGHPADSALLNG